MSHLAEELSFVRRLPSPVMRKAIRETAGVSQQRIADELQVHRVTVARWESGARHPRGPILERYSLLLAELKDLDAS